MLTRLDSRRCEVWLDDTTVHQVRPELLILDRTSLDRTVRLDRERHRCPPAEKQWMGWTVAEHLAHHAKDRPAVCTEPRQEELFVA